MKAKRVPHVPAQPQPLTPSEEEILRILSAYRYMTALDVAYSLFSPNSLPYVRRLLAALSGGKDYQERQFLYRFPLPSAKPGNRERVYTLGAAGREVVESVGIPVEWYYRPSKVGRLSGSHVAHQLLVTRFVVAASWWVSKHPEYTLSEVRLSYELEKSLTTLADGHARASAAAVPDAWLHIREEGTDDGFPILVEIDRGSEYQERFKQHVRARLAFIQSGDYERVFGTPAVIIAYATTGQIRAYADTRRRTMGAWIMEVLTELNMEDWAGIFQLTTLAPETLYEEAQALFAKPVWYHPDSSTAVPLLGS